LVRKAPKAICQINIPKAISIISINLGDKTAKWGPKTFGIDTCFKHLVGLQFEVCLLSDNYNTLFFLVFLRLSTSQPTVNPSPKPEKQPKTSPITPTPPLVCSIKSRN
jgi:hypothetical protein